MPRPKLNDYAPYYGTYISKVNGENVLQVLEDQLEETQAFLTSISEDQGNYSYQTGKWSIKEVIGHIIDTERVMAYRALSIARGEKKELPGFDQDEFVINANFNNRSVANLAYELMFLRESNLVLFKSFDKDDFSKRGVASGNEVTVEALLYIIAGHEIHHINFLKENYL